jgi:hypothetical protein
MCPIGGKICLQNFSDSIFNIGCAASIHEKIVEGIKPRSAPAKEDSLGNIDQLEPDKKVGEKADGAPDVCEEEEKEKFVNSKYARCAYESCKEREKCPYFNAKAEIDNNSKELKNNFEKDRPQDNTAYREMHSKSRREYPDLGWGYQGHHIISGNQVFMALEKSTGNLKYGHLLMLANMCGYNINNANNCILLPSQARQEGPWGTLEVFEKEAKAFDVMDIMKRQWHLGGHAYTIPKDSLKYYKPTNEQVLMSGSGEYFPDYASSVQSKLNKVSERYSRKRCWKKLNTPEFRREFVQTMDETSFEIEKSLMKFSTRPKDSYPYFVSKTAVDYAYDAPKTGKIIILYYKGDRIYASKFRVSRKQKNNYAIVVTQNEEQPSIRITTEGMREFVRYAENVMHFWIDSRIEAGLPWNCEDEYICRRTIDGNDIYKFACDNATELFTYIDKNEVVNHGQAAQIRKRWREVKENVGICD